MESVITQIKQIAESVASGSTSPQDAINSLTVSDSDLEALKDAIGALSGNQSDTTTTSDELPATDEPDGNADDAPETEPDGD